MFFVEKNCFLNGGISSDTISLIAIGMGGLRDEAFNGIMMPGNSGHIKRKLF